MIWNHVFDVVTFIGVVMTTSFGIAVMVTLIYLMLIGEPDDNEYLG